MALSPEALDALLAAGASAEMIVAAVKADIAAAARTAEAAQTAKREKAAEIKRRQRAELRGELDQVSSSPVDLDGLIGTSQDKGGLSAPPLNPPQTPPIIPTPPSSLRSDSQPKRRERFAEFWLAYPKRSGSNPKQPAEEKFYRLVKSSSDPAKLVDEILDGARRYATSVQGGDPRFTAQAVTWLNQGRWRDEHSAVLPLGGPRAGPPPPRSAPHNPRLAASRKLAEYLDEQPH